LILVRDTKQYSFGAFTLTDWERKPDFYGESDAFLFTLQPKLRIYKDQGYNENRQYLNYDSKTLPNGLGMGGQLEFFGLWLEQGLEKGQSRAEPLSSTFGSPCLASGQEFSIRDIEAWCVRESDRERVDPRVGTAAELNPDAVGLLEMSGRRMYGKEV
ncbi:TLD-domain-containing protein, partial [Piptocephalis cylindrospora]